MYVLPALTCSLLHIIVVYMYMVLLQLFSRLHVLLCHVSLLYYCYYRNCWDCYPNSGDCFWPHLCIVHDSTKKKNWYEFTLSTACTDSHVPYLKKFVLKFSRTKFRVKIFSWVWQTMKIIHAKRFEHQKWNTRKISNVYVRSCTRAENPRSTTCQPIIELSCW